MKKGKKSNILADGSFISSMDGSHIYFKRYFPKNISGKVKHIIFQHGAIEYHKRYEEFFQYLQKHMKGDIIISCMDLVGHGYSGGGRAYVENFQYYIEDFLKFTRVHTDIYLQYEVEETHIVAHSLGGMITIKALVDYIDQIPFSITSLILTNPCIKPKLEFPKFALEFLENVSSKMGKVRIPSLYKGKDLTNDVKKAIQFDTDQLNSPFMTISMGNAIVKMSKEIMSYSYYLSIPTFFVLSDNDVIVDLEITKLFMSGMDKSLVKILNFPGTKHDILNETCRMQVFQEIIDYIESSPMEME